MRLPAFSPRRAWPFIILAAAGLVMAVFVEHGSIERANRLHRAGELQGAAGIYQQRLEGDSVDRRVRYNLGTTLLAAGVSSAVVELSAGARSRDPDVRLRSLYNLGFWHVVRASTTESPDSARLYALASVEANKGVLRLDPDRTDARWNLAMAQRILTASEASDGRGGGESVEGFQDPEALIRPEEAPETQDETAVGEDGPREGSNEAPAQGLEDDALTLLEADDILGSGHLDASTMIRKLLAFEGRAQRRTRLGRTTPRW